MSPFPTGTPQNVVVSGIGLWTGLAPDREGTWAALRAGRSAAGWLDEPATPNRAGFRLPGPERRGIEILDRVAAEALADAGLAGTPHADPARVGVVVGLSKGELSAWRALDRALKSSHENAIESAVPGVFSEFWPNGPAARIASHYGFQGPSLAPIAACATGVVAALRAWSLIIEGVCDVVIAGSADASLSPFVLGAFERMRVLAGAGDDPKAAVRPWDRDRAGFLIGEGGAALVLEREEHARARGLRPAVAFAGGALGSDAFHLTQLDENPERLARLIAEALDRSQIDYEEVDHINVHGTATRVNDPLECRAIRRALGTRADGISCCANKAQIGHLLGGSGAAELAIACLALRDQFVPPTLNLENPDPACDLDATPHVGRSRRLRAALKIALGFGGHFAVAALRRLSDTGDRNEADSQ